MGASLVQAIMDGPEGPYEHMSIQGISAVDGSVVLPEQTFQFWPETINVEHEIGWAFKDLPGASHSLAQWTNNAGKTISFEVVLSRFLRPVDTRGVFDLIFDPLKLTKPDATLPTDMRPLNISVKNALKFFEGFKTPTYKPGAEGMIMALPPPIAILYIPGLALNEDGRDAVWCVMTSFSVTYNLLFPNGEPRLATVSLSFKQIVQQPGVGVFWKGLTEMEAANLGPEAAVPFNGGYPAPGWAPDKP